MLKRFPVSQGRLMSAIQGYMDGVAKRISGRAGSINPTERAKLYGMEQMARDLGVDCSCFPSERTAKKQARLVCRCRPMTTQERAEAVGRRPYLTGFRFDGAHCRGPEGKFVPVPECTGRPRTKPRPKPKKRRARAK